MPCRLRRWGLREAGSGSAVSPAEGVCGERCGGGGDVCAVPDRCVREGIISLSGGKLDLPSVL